MQLHVARIFFENISPPYIEMGYSAFAVSAWAGLQVHPCALKNQASESQTPWELNRKYIFNVIIIYLYINVRYRYHPNKCPYGFG
jgi:hypothetical protein